MFAMRVFTIILTGSLAAGLLASPADAASESVLHSFQDAPADGGLPLAGLIEVSGGLFGTTSSAGTVFAITTAGVETVVHSFASAGDGRPFAGLIDVGGALYGTTIDGGTMNLGTVFRIVGTTKTVLHSFKGGSDGANPAAELVVCGALLCGTTANGGLSNLGTVFNFNTTTNVETTVYAFQGGNDGASGSNLTLGALV